MPRASDLVRSIWVPGASAQVATVQPSSRSRLVRRLTIIGPDYSVFTFYLGLVIASPYVKSTTNTGVRNTASFDNTPLEIPAGSSALGVWTGGSTAAGTVGLLTLEWDVDDGQ